MNDIISIIKDYGWPGALAAGIGLLAYKFLSIWIPAKWNAIKKSDAVPHPHLNMHAFFNSMDYYLNVDLPALNVFPDKPVRRALTKDLIRCSLLSIREVSERLIKFNYADRSIEEWNFNTKSMINDMHTSFLEKSRAKGIPAIVSARYSDWYFYRLNALRSSSDNVAQSLIWTTRENRTFVFLLILEAFVSTMIGDCVSIINKLNGEITGMIYNGGTVEPLAPELESANRR